MHIITPILKKKPANQTLMKHLLILTSLLIPALGFGNLISVNFSNGQALNGPAGLPDLNTVVETSSWLQQSGIGAAVSTFFADGSSAATVLDSTGGNGGGLNQFFGPSYANNLGRLLNGAIMDYPTSAGGFSISFSGMNTDFPSGYVAIVYLNGFAGNTASTISDGTTTYYWTNLADNTSFDGTMTQATYTVDDGTFPVAQYALFGSAGSPLTADSLTLSYEALAGGGTGIAGVQLLDVTAVPEPGTVALFGGVLALLFVLRRRRGKR